MTYVIGGATCPGADMQWTKCMDLRKALMQCKYSVHSIDSIKVLNTLQNSTVHTNKLG